MTQAELAQRAGTSQPTVAAYEAGRKSPTLRTLHRLASSVGLEPVLEFHRPMRREERRSLALHEAIADALDRDPEGVRLRAKQSLERMEGVAPTSQAVREWGVLLDRSVQSLREVLLDRSPWARELRHVTPFAGVLTARERTMAIKRFTASERERDEA